MCVPPSVVVMRRRARRKRVVAARTAATRGGFTVARAFRQWYLVQATPLSLSDFRRQLADRGLRFGPFDDGPFETLDREDLLRPVGYALHGFAWQHDPQGSLASGALLLRDEHGFIPWDQLRSRASRRYDANLYVLYHRWQPLWVHELAQMLAIGSQLSALGRGLEGYFDFRAKASSVPDLIPRRQLLERAKAARRRELMLLRVQNVFLPGLRGGRYRADAIARLTDDAAIWTHRQQQRFHAPAHARALGADPAEIAAAVEYFTIVGRRVDPNEHLFILLDGVARSRIEKLRGDARIAWDHYDAARLLRAFYEELTGSSLPDVDELFDLGGGRYKLDLYGTRRPGRDRAALPHLLDDFGLYPHRVELIGEGESELVALEEILAYRHGLSFERLGVSTTDLSGADVPTAARRLFASLRRYANYFLLVMDNEGTAREMLDELLRSGIIEDISDTQRKRAVAEALTSLNDQVFNSDEERREALRAARARGNALDEEPGEAPEHILWRENLEADNFSRRELRAVMEELAVQEGLDGWQLPGDALAAAIDDPARSKSIASIAVELAEQQQPPLRVTKPDFVRALARYAVDHPELHERPRPILELAEHLVRLTWASRQLRGTLRPE